MSQPLPEELQRRCAQIVEENAQGIPLSAFDYLLLTVATVIIPTILIVVGALL
jgi:hypothetical protein